jgi:hypothetical protein
VFNLLGCFEQGTEMRWRFCSRSVAIGGSCLILALAGGVQVEPVHAQAQPFNGFNESYPQWLVANPYVTTGFIAGPSFATAINQQAYTAKLGSGTVGFFAESSGGGASGFSNNFFGASPAFPTSLREDWFSNLGNPAWRTSVFGSYKSDINAGLFNGLYTTASFGITDFKSTLPGFSGLTNFSAGNDAVAVTTSAGIGLQLTPQISVEGSVSWTQLPSSTFR